MVQHDNPFVKFADDELFDEVSNSYEQYLIERGLVQLTPESKEEVKKGKLEEKDIQLEF
jgi:hypothetical protein